MCAKRWQAFTRWREHHPASSPHKHIVAPRMPVPGPNVRPVLRSSTSHKRADIAVPLCGGGASATAASHGIRSSVTTTTDTTTGLVVIGIEGELQVRPRWRWADG